MHIFQNNNNNKIGANMTYVVHNKKTNEIYTINGAIGEYHNWHQVKMIRDGLNDCEAIVKDYEGTTSTYVERPNNWQVIEKPENIKTHEVPVNRSTRSGAGFIQATSIRAYAIGEVTPVKRNPADASSKKKSEVSRGMSDSEAQMIYDQIARLDKRIETIQWRIANEVDEELRDANLVRVIQFKTDIVKLRMELNKAGR